MDNAFARSSTSRPRVHIVLALVATTLGALLALYAGTGSAAIPATQNESPWVLPGLVDPATDKRAEQPVVDTGPDGTTVMAWVQYTYSNSSVIRARVKEPGGSFGPALVLSVERPNATVMDPRVDVGADGSIAVAWAYWDLWADAGPSIVVRAAFRPAGGAFRPDRPVSVGDRSWRAPQHQVAAGTGNAHIVWVQAEGGLDVIKRAVIDANGIRQLSPLKAHSGFADEGQQISDAGHPRLDVGGEGVGAIVWREFIDQSSMLPFGPAETVRLTRFDASNGNLVASERLTGFFREARSVGVGNEWTWAADNGPPDVAVDGVGRTLVVWRQDTWIELKPASTGGTNHIKRSEPRIKAVEFSPDGTRLGPASDVSVATGSERDLAVEVAPNGSAAAIWNNGDGHWDVTAEPDATADIFVAARKAGDPALMVTRVKSSRGRVVSTAVDVSPGGRATAIWTRGADGNSLVETRQVNADGTLEPTTRLSDLTGSPYGPVAPGPYTNPLDSSVAVGPDGNAYAAWSTQLTHRRIQWTTTDRDPELRLNLEFTGEGSGRVTSQPAGVDCEESCETFHRFMETVRLTAQASPGSELVGWEGECATTNGNACEVRMGVASTVRAEFARAFDLDVDLIGPGHGRVVSSPVGIDCGADCGETVRAGKVVTLHAQPASGSTFVSWSGACSGGQPTCQVTMDEAKFVSAEFSRFFNLQVSRGGVGSVTSQPAGINCSSSAGSCLKAFEIGTQVTLTASPAEGSGFTGWAGACSGDQLTCVVNIDGGKVVGASFTSGFELTANIMSMGSGSVSTTEGPMNCSPSICRGEFTPDSQVELVAGAKPGFAFANWSGACERTEETCVVTMDQARQVTAHFDPGEKVSVAFSGAGSGRVTSDPGGIDCVSDSTCEGWYLLGSDVTLNAIPDPGSVFAGWEKSDPSDHTGGCAGTDDSCVARAGLPVRVTARFEPEPVEPDPTQEITETPDAGGSTDECLAPVLQVSQVKRSPNGTATLRIGAPRAGVAVIRGSQVKNARVKVKRGWSRIRVRPAIKLARKLRKRGSLRTRVAVQFLTADECGSTPSRARVLFRG